MKRGHCLDTPNDVAAPVTRAQPGRGSLARTSRKIQRCLDRCGQFIDGNLLHRHGRRSDPGEVQSVRMVELVENQRQQHLGYARAQRLGRSARAAVMDHDRSARKKQGVGCVVYYAPGRGQCAGAEPGSAGTYQGYRLIFRPP